jgi:hypothetical protein
MADGENSLPSTARTYVSLVPLDCLLVPRIVALHEDLQGLFKSLKVALGGSPKSPPVGPELFNCLQEVVHHRLHLSLLEYSLDALERRKDFVEGVRDF